MPFSAASMLAARDVATKRGGQARRLNIPKLHYYSEGQ